MELVLNNDTVELVHESGNWILKRGAGFSAVQMVANAAGACGIYVLNSILSNSNIPCEVIKAFVSYTVDENNRVRPLKSISIEYHVRVEEEYKPRVERILKLVHKSCPVMQSLDPNIDVIETLVYN